MRWTADMVGVLQGVAQGFDDPRGGFLYAPLIRLASGGYLTIGRKVKLTAKGRLQWACFETARRMAKETAR